jgi:alanine dehydrogenase
MKFFIPKETRTGELRVPLLPADVAKLVRAGAEITGEREMGAIHVSYRDLFIILV